MHSRIKLMKIQFDAWVTATLTGGGFNNSTQTEAAGRSSDGLAGSSNHIAS
jgi:hypothetical protein